MRDGTEEEEKGGICWPHLIDGLAQRAREAHPQEEGDYRQGELLYCGVCNKPKETVIVSEVLGRRVVPCLCGCGERQRDEEQARRDEAARYRPAGTEPGPGAVFRNPAWAECRFEGAEDTEVIRKCRRYAGNFETLLPRGTGMILFGSPGTGKSFAAACAANALGDRGYRCLMTNFSRISAEQPDFDRRAAYFESFADWDLLIVDDFLSERQTEYMQEIVYNVIDLRTSRRRPVLLTTNLNRSDLQEPPDPALRRITSRLMERCVCLPVQGEDRRARQNDDRQELLRLLNGGEKGKTGNKG